MVLNSEREPVVQSAVQELELQAEVAELVGADVIVLHGGGAAGGIAAALDRLERGLVLLSRRARERLALENDDRCFTPRIWCRCASGPAYRWSTTSTITAAAGRAVGGGGDRARLCAPGENGSRTPTSRRPGTGGRSPNPRAHADYIDPADFPECWRDRTITIDVEAKAKERAVLALKGSHGD